LLGRAALLPPAYLFTPSSPPAGSLVLMVLPAP